MRNYLVLSAYLLVSRDLPLWDGSHRCCEGLNRFCSFTRFQIIIEKLDAVIQVRGLGDCTTPGHQAIHADRKFSIVTNKHDLVELLGHIAPHIRVVSRVVICCLVSDVYESNPVINSLEHSFEPLGLLLGLGG